MGKMGAITSPGELIGCSFFCGLEMRKVDTMESRRENDFR